MSVSSAASATIAVTLVATATSLNSGLRSGGKALIGYDLGASITPACAVNRGGDGEANNRC